MWGNWWTRGRVGVVDFGKVSWKEKRKTQEKPGPSRPPWRSVVPGSDLRRLCVAVHTSAIQAERTLLNSPSFLLLFFFLWRQGGDVRTRSSWTGKMLAPPTWVDPDDHHKPERGGGWEKGLTSLCAIRKMGGLSPSP